MSAVIDDIPASWLESKPWTDAAPATLAAVKLGGVEMLCACGHPVFWHSIERPEGPEGAGWGTGRCVYSDHLPLTESACTCPHFTVPEGLANPDGPAQGS